MVGCHSKNRSRLTIVEIFLRNYAIGLLYIRKRRVLILSDVDIDLSTLSSGAVANIGDYFKSFTGFRYKMSISCPRERFELIDSVEHSSITVPNFYKIYEIIG